MADPTNISIDASTLYCAVYGSPVRHSASPAMQNAGLSELGLNWKYLAFDVAPEHLEQAILGAKRMNFVGLNLTVPHKLLAVKMMDALDRSAETWGAVNTVRFETQSAEGEWLPIHRTSKPGPSVRAVGFNTDADAIVRSIREDLNIDPAGARILILGAGGAGRVAALRLAREKPRSLYLINRTLAKAEAVAGEIQSQCPDCAAHVGYPSEEVDLIVNATSLGLSESDSFPLNLEEFPLKKTKAVYDMIYRPAETPLLKAALEAGCRTANGIGMLLYQGARALEIWTGRDAPVASMKKALLNNIYGLTSHSPQAAS